MNTYSIILHTYDDKSHYNLKHEIRHKVEPPITDHDPISNM